MSKNRSNVTIVNPTAPISLEEETAPMKRRSMTALDSHQSHSAYDPITSPGPHNGTYSETTARGTLTRAAGWGPGPGAGSGGGDGGGRREAAVSVDAVPMEQFVWSCPTAGTCLGNNVCRPGHFGPTCGVCMSGWVMGSNGLCTDCTGGSAEQTKDLAVAVIVMAGAQVWYKAVLAPLLQVTSSCPACAASSRRLAALRMLAAPRLSAPRLLAPLRCVMSPVNHIARVVRGCSGARGHMLGRDNWSSSCLGRARRLGLSPEVFSQSTCGLVSRLRTSHSALSCRSVHNQLCLNRTPVSNRMPVQRLV